MSARDFVKLVGSLFYDNYLMNNFNILQGFNSCYEAAEGMM
ncbi:hypothetical protein predicted by Glimmer/Critica [Bdellovibrio bacteriovorus HD100]|uniref:Uncharacterized protein n=1 Tax=Bdellovibrio bacteriovorus (strain ATCC 15356 / DSM 50701 / NCIMB 9529 / HD100) TaxID=264462 RepID=Q6MNF9_BDEBA|nr:hypothetical protein predicted by Glimmer/Critica [Bdellovibrio bacteriovorus HD100]